MKFNLAIILDGIFTGTVTFLMSFILLSSLVPYQLNWVFSVVLSICATAFCLYRLSKKHSLKLTGISDKLNKENLMFYLSLSKNEKIFVTLFARLGKTLIKTPKGLYFTQENAYVFPYFTFDALSKEKIASFYKRANGKKSFLLCDAPTEDIKAFCLPLNIKVVGGEEVYLLFKKAEMLPEKQLNATKRRRFEEIKLAVFSRKKTPKYFLFGITFMFFSFLVPFKFYYVFFGSLCLILSIICLFVSTPKTKKELDF